MLESFQINYLAVLLLNWCSLRRKRASLYLTYLRLEIQVLVFFSPMATLPNDGQVLLLFYFLLIVVLGIVLKICYLIYKKFHYNFEPVHVFMLNYLRTLALYKFTAQITTLLMIFPASEDVSLQYLFLLFASLNFSFGIICMQTDRFLAVYWSIR
jgi:hypothetical protein